MPSKKSKIYVWGWVKHFIFVSLYHLGLYVNIYDNLSSSQNHRKKI